MHMTHDPSSPPAPEIAFDQFLAVDIRVGTILAAHPFPEARKPAFILEIDFGPVIGRKRSSVQITENYTLEDLPGRQVAAVVNFPPAPDRPETLGSADFGFSRRSRERRPHSTVRVRTERRPPVLIRTAAPRARARESVRLLCDFPKIRRLKRPPCHSIIVASDR